jgi:hypothetical protein
MMLTNPFTRLSLNSERYNIAWLDPWEKGGKYESKQRKKFAETLKAIRKPRTFKSKMKALQVRSEVRSGVRKVE